MINEIDKLIDDVQDGTFPSDYTCNHDVAVLTELKERLLQSENDLYVKPDTDTELDTAIVEKFIRLWIECKGVMLDSDELVSMMFENSAVLAAAGCINVCMDRSMSQYIDWDYETE